MQVDLVGNTMCTLQDWSLMSCTHLEPRFLVFVQNESQTMCVKIILLPCCGYYPKMYSHTNSMPELILKNRSWTIWRKACGCFCTGQENQTKRQWRQFDVFFGYKWTLVRAYLICRALKQACVYLLTMLWEVLSQNSFSLVVCSWLCEVSEIPCVKEVIGLPGLSLLSRKPCLASVVIS